MRNLFCAVVSLASFFAFVMPDVASAGNGEHHFGKMWKEYEEAVKADRPQKQIKVLEKIINASMNGHISWDFYDACDKYVSTMSSVNWKDREKAQKKVLEFASEFDEPIVDYMMLGFGGRVKWEQMEQFLTANESRLKKSHNTAFYINFSNGIPCFITDGLNSDYDYILWSLVNGKYYLQYEHGKEISALLKNSLGSEYPAAAYLEYLGIASGSDEYDEDEDGVVEHEERIDALKAYVKAYEGKAVALFARKDLLQNEMNELASKQGAKDYRAFRNKCAEFEKARRTFKGTEAEIAAGCREVESLIDELDSRRISVSDNGKDLLVSLRNLDGFKFSVRSRDDKKVIWETELKNTINSYYSYDTLTVNLPPLDDGSYMLVVSNGSLKAEGSFGKYSISLACRQRDNGYAVYAADYITGRPIEEADINIIYKGDTIKTIRNFRFDGFTQLGEEAGRLLKKYSRSRIACSYRDTDGLLRKSNVLVVSAEDVMPDSTPAMSEEGRIFLDRAAFNPGDTVSFKAIAFNRMPDRTMAVVEEGRRLKVELRDVNGKVMQTSVLGTNCFGSVSGQFIIPGKTENNGRYSVSVYDGGKEIASEYFIVDEFVLPEFVISFDKSDKLYMAGDTVVVKGSVRSYSGHAMTGAKVSCSVTSEGLNESGNLSLRPDGSFEISFVSAKKDYSWYQIAVTVVSRTGETHEKRMSQTVFARLRLSAEVLDAADGQVEFAGDDNYRYIPYHNNGGNASIIRGDKAKVKVVAGGYYSDVASKLPVSYRLKYGREVVTAGTVVSGNTLELDMKDRPSGLYVLETELVYKNYRGEEEKVTDTHRLVKVSEKDKVLNVKGIANLFLEAESGRIGLLFGATDGPVYAVTELHDDKGRLIEAETVFLKGEAGKEGSIVRFDKEYKAEYSDKVVLNVFFFKNGKSTEYRAEFSRPEEKYGLPLEFAVFTDKSYPGAFAEYSVKTVPGVECLVSVYDKSSETIKTNNWYKIDKWQQPCRIVYTEVENGYLHAYGTGYLNNCRRYSSNMIPDVAEDALEGSVAGMVPSAVPMMKSAGVADKEMRDEGMADVGVRDNFSKTIAFYPYLRSDKDGYVKFMVRPADKLSTFNVQVFAHDRMMRNGVLRREMTVTLPCKVSVNEPQVLYAGDVYRMKVSVSNSEDQPLDGTVALYVYDTEDYRNAEPIMTFERKVSVGASGEDAAEFEITVPEGTGVLGFKAVYSAKTAKGGVSDGVFVKVPVKRAVQVIREAHSAVYLDGMDKDVLVRMLEGRFVNGQPYGAEYSEIDIRDMLRKALPETLNAGGDDVLALADAWYSWHILEWLGEKPDGTAPEVLMQKILDCRNADGGFSWYPGMDSSVMLTAMLLEKSAHLGLYGDGGLSEGIISDAVGYIDARQFGSDERWNCLGMEQYLHLRSAYPSVPFDVKVDRKVMKEFRKEVKEYLVPKKERGMEGMIMRKARRANTLRNLTDGGLGLLQVWDIKISDRQIAKSMFSDLMSLSEYAVSHNDGAVYFPNAVMPFRGLLETELYAHILLCRMFDWAAEDVAEGRLKADAKEFSRISDGIRLWIMLQKETQHWENDSAYIEAVAAVLEGREALLDTKIVILSKNFLKPFDEVKASSNGLTINRKYYLVPENSMSVEGWKEIRDGYILNVGDKVMAVYDVWSRENRSFVRITAPRNAALSPIDNQSGYSGTALVRSRGMYWMYSRCYRTVRTDRTEMYFYVLPEENTRYEEEFFVTRSGEFRSPVVEIESVYAPHYRANDEYEGVFIVR